MQSVSIVSHARSSHGDLILLLEQSQVIMADLSRRVPFHSLPEPMYAA